MEAENLNQHLNRKGGFPMYAIAPAPQKGMEEVEKKGWRAQRHTDSISKALYWRLTKDHLLLMGLEFPRGWAFFSINTSLSTLKTW